MSYPFVTLTGMQFFPIKLQWPIGWQESGGKGKTREWSKEGIVSRKIWEINNYGTRQLKAGSGKNVLWYTRGHTEDEMQEHKETDRKGAQKKR